MPKTLCPRCGVLPSRVKTYRSGAKGTTWCQPCRTEYRRQYRYKRMSLTQKQYEALWINQRSRCALCGKKGDKGAVGRRPSLVVDHDHETQKIRGLLCGGCNVALGYIEKVSVEWLEKAMIYLRV